jgi:hypothetical protein
MMTLDVPKEFHDETRRFRLQALQMLYIEELLAENLPGGSKDVYC